MLRKGLSSQIKFQKDRCKVVLLVHCFRNSPRILSEISNILYSNGYSIYNLRLPGHGCVNDEILKIKLRDWECYVENIFLDLSDNFDEIYCCGLSLGATLLLNMATKYSNIKKIVALSPFLKPRQKYSFLSMILRLFVKKLKPSDPDCTLNHEVLNDFIPFFPLFQGYECVKLANKVRNNINNIKTKTLVFLAKNDHDMNYSDHKKILEKNSLFKIVTLINTFHLIPIDVEKKFVNGKILEWFNE